MISNGQVKGIITFLTKLTHTVDSFRFKFVNVSVEKVKKIGLLVPHRSVTNSFLNVF